MSRNCGCGSLNCVTGRFALRPGVANVVVRRFLLRFVSRQELRHLVVQRRDERLERFRRRLEDALALQRLEIQAIEERTIAFG